MKRDKYSKNIRIAIVATVLLVAPGALAIGEYLRGNLVQVDIDVKTEVPSTEKDLVQEE